MARFIVTLQPASGHLQPLLPYLRALSARHEVLVATSESFVPTVEGVGLRARGCGVDWLESEAEATFPEISELSGFALDLHWLRELFLGPPAAATAEDVRDLAREWKPDAILCETWEFGGHLAAESVDVPHALLGVGARIPPRRLQMLGGEQLQAHRRGLGLPDAEPGQALYRWACLTPSLPSWLRPDDEPLPTDHFFAPLSAVRDGPSAPPEWLSEHAGDRPLVYVTLGTVFNQTPGAMERILEGLADGPWAVVATIGRGRDPAEFGGQADNVRVESFVPHDEILPFCDAVVSHAGHTTTLDAVYAGAPHVAVPLQADQPVNAGTIERLGLGRLVDPGAAELNAAGVPQVDLEALMPRMVREAVEDVLGSASDHASAIERVRDEIAELPGPDRFVELLEDLATNRRPLVRDTAT